MIDDSLCGRCGGGSMCPQQLQHAATRLRGCWLASLQEAAAATHSLHVTALAWGPLRRTCAMLGAGPARSAHTMMRICMTSLNFGSSGVRTDKHVNGAARRTRYCTRCAMGVCARVLSAQVPPNGVMLACNSIAAALPSGWGEHWPCAYNHGA